MFTNKLTVESEATALTAQAPRDSTHAKRADQSENVQMLHAIYSIVPDGISRCYVLLQSIPATPVCV